MNLIHLRQQIDAIDTTLLQLMRRRMELARQTREYKKAIQDEKREEFLHQKWVEEAQQLGLSPEFATLILNKILAESTRLQKLSPPSSMA